MADVQPFVTGALLTVAEVAAGMRVSNMTVYRLIKSGELPAVRVGKGYRIRESELRALPRGAFRPGGGGLVAKGRIGLDIGSTAVRAVELTGGDPPTVIKAAQVPLPAGAVENGEVKEPEVVAEALRELWERGGFKAKRVYMGVGNQRVVVREIALPYLPEKELRASLGFQVQEFIPMAVDEAVLDYDPIGEFEQDDRRMLRMLLVAAQRQMVDTVVSAATGAQARAGRPRPRAVRDGALGRHARASAWISRTRATRRSSTSAPTSPTSWCTREAPCASSASCPSGGRDITLAIARGIGVEDDVAERLKRGEEVELEVPPRVDEEGGDEVAELPI